MIDGCEFERPTVIENFLKDGCHRFFALGLVARVGTNERTNPRFAKNPIETLSLILKIEKKRFDRHLGMAVPANISLGAWNKKLRA